MNKEQQERHDKAWKILEDKGLTLGQRMKVRSSFASMNDNKEPYVDTKYKDGEVEYYHSTHDLIKSMMFNTVEEVVLANAIYLNMPDDYGKNEFRDIFKFTCRVIGMNNAWSV